MEKTNIPTYKEFRDAVIKDFSKNRGNKTDEQVEYCISENEDIIKGDYKTNVWELESGFIDREKFMHAGVYACAYNLYLLV